MNRHFGLNRNYFIQKHFCNNLADSIFFINILLLYKIINFILLLKYYN